MFDDPIVAETRRLRDEYASQFNYDLDAISKSNNPVAGESSLSEHPSDPIIMMLSGPQAQTEIDADALQRDIEER